MLPADILALSLYGDLEAGLKALAWAIAFAGLCIGVGLILNR